MITICKKKVKFDKKNKLQDMSAEKKTEKKIFLYDYLDGLGLTRAERSYYQKHYNHLRDEEKTVVEWVKIIKLVHK